MNLEKVSVIIPCYKQAQYLGEAIQSIFEQTYQNWECIIVNDGSPDDTENVAREWCLKDARFKYLYKENGGLSSARNSGIQESIGEYILTLDADDKYDTTFIEKALVILKKSKKTGIVSSWVCRFSENNRFELIKPNGSILKDFLFSNAAIGTSLFRKECWANVGGYDEEMRSGYEDWEFYIRVCKAGWDVFIIQEPLFFYRQHIISMRTIALNNYDKKIKKYIYLKHKELYIGYYEDMVDYFLNTIDLEKKNSIKIRNKIDFRLGHFILKPLRLIKSFLSK